MGVCAHRPGEAARPHSRAGSWEAALTRILRERHKGGGRRIRRGLVHAGAWAGGVLGGVVAVVVVATWVWWWPAPSAGQGSRGVNALWARHQWVGQGHSDGEYRALADTLRRGEISDVFFHVGPLDPDGSIPPGRYAHARALLAAMDRLAPGVRSQAYVGQVTSQGGGPLDLTRQAVRDRIVGTARTLLDLGFKGIHYDIELPADWLVGRHFAWQAKHVTELVGDQVTVFIGVPTYAQGQPFPWAENLRSAIRGTRRGLDRL